jgi:hypothetical protein
MPYIPGILGGSGVFFGANNCSGHPQLLLKDHRYTYEIVAGQVLGQPVTLNEQCGSIFQDYMQPGFLYLAANGGLPPVTTQATEDVAGSIAVRSYTPLPIMHITTAGVGSGFNYCYATEVWVAGGKQTTPLACNSVTPIAPTGLHNVQVHLALPSDWTRYKVFLNSTTDPAFTPGVWFDVTTTTGLPRPSQCDFGTFVNCSGGIGSGLFIQPFTPTDTSTLATANIGLNMTGTYNANLASPTIPASTGTLCVPGQQVSDVAGGFDYICNSEDHWLRSGRSWGTF